jgi:hypothetical protein
LKPMLSGRLPGFRPAARRAHRAALLNVETAKPRQWPCVGKALNWQGQP